MATNYVCSICRDTVPPHHQRTMDLKCCTNHFHCSKQVQMCHICLVDLWEKFEPTGVANENHPNDQAVSQTKWDEFKVWCYHFIVCNSLVGSPTQVAAIRLTTQVAPSELLRANNGITQRTDQWVAFQKQYTGSAGLSTSIVSKKHLEKLTAPELSLAVILCCSHQYYPPVNAFLIFALSELKRDFIFVRFNSQLLGLNYQICPANNIR